MRESGGSVGGAAGIVRGLLVSGSDRDAEGAAKFRVGGEQGGGAD